MEGELYDPTTRDREIQGLLEAMQVHHLESGVILTENEEEELEIEIDQHKVSISILPVWKWALSQKI